MALRPLLLSAVIGLASVFAFHSPAAEARGYVSVSIGHPPPPRHERYAHRPGYAWVPGRWISTGYRHVWQPGHYVRLRSAYRPAYYGGGYRHVWQPGHYVRLRSAYRPAYYGGGYRHLPPRRVIRHVGRPYRPVYGPTRPGYRVVYRQPGWGW